VLTWRTIIRAEFHSLGFARLTLPVIKGWRRAQVLTAD